MRVCRAVLLAAFCLGSERADAQATEYHWPLDLPRILTSSFGEYRAGRFHMGIDLRTGPVGQPVYAADNGYVSRVRCSPYGYGKAVYLQLENGDAVVYGHLDAFNAVLTEYVRDAQHARENYTVDLYPESSRFPVTRGDLIAYAGQTGVGVPHLHYELRDSTGAPINPRLRNITWPDTTAPKISKAAVVPAAPDATVNGDLLPVVLTAQPAGANAYRTAPVTVDGAVALAIDVVDPANGGSTKLGVHTVETRAGEQTIFKLIHDRIDYAHSQDGVVAYHPYLEDYGRFLVQWRWPGNDTAAYAFSKGDGRLVLADDSTDIVITATDFWGNACTLTIPLKRDQIARLDKAGATSPEGQSGAVEYTAFSDWLVVTALFELPEPTAPILMDAVAGEHRPMQRIDDGTFRAAFAPAPGSVETTLAVEHLALPFEPRRYLVATRGEPGRSKNLGGVDVKTAPDTAYGRLFIAVDQVDPPAPNSELVALGKAYAVGDSDAPVEGPIEIGLPVNGETRASSRSMVYRNNGRAWRPMQTRFHGSRAIVQTTSLGLFQLMEDTTAPAVSFATPADNANTGTRPEIRIRVRDGGSGIAEANAWANGSWLLMAYDPEGDELVWERDVDLAAGENVIQVRVVDQAGNVAELEGRIRVNA